MSSKDTIRYDLIVQKSMLDVVHKVLKDTEKDGLPSDHHFYITFGTTYNGVEIPAHLLEKYPEEITIVLQHEFEDLQVHETYFQVNLWFNNVAAHLKIPFVSIRAFFDPSVKFGLQFNPIEEEVEDTSTKDTVVQDLPVSEKKKDTKKKSTKKKSKKEDEKSAEKDNIVSLDSFRKK